MGVPSPAPRYPRCGAAFPSSKRCGILFFGESHEGRLSRDFQVKVHSTRNLLSAPFLARARNARPSELAVPFAPLTRCPVLSKHSTFFFEEGSYQT